MAFNYSRGMSEAKKNHRAGHAKKIATIIVAIIVAMHGFDLWQDLANGAPSLHLAWETVMIGLGTTSFVLLVLSTLKKATRLESRLDETRKDLQEWREKARLHTEGLANEIDHQFMRWGLSPAEKEVGFLILKGLSFKEAAEIRKASERTVRQQAQDIYRKSSIAGRNEFTAWFLEDLLTAKV